MVLVVIVAIRTIDGVELATTLILRSASFVRYPDCDSPFTVLSCMLLLERLRNARHMKWSAT
eukprot:6125510-Amphidinium_carterae.1